jgi:hypothetical protein
MHARVYRERGPADHCENRDNGTGNGCASITYQWAHIHDTDPGDPANYRSLCRQCHMLYDGQHGETHGSAILTADQAAEIRRLYAGRARTQMSLAAEYGVHQTTISKVVLNKSHNWYPQPEGS